MRSSRRRLGMPSLADPSRTKRRGLRGGGEGGASFPLCLVFISWRCRPTVQVEKWGRKGEGGGGPWREGIGAEQRLALAFSPSATRRAELIN